MAEAAYASLPPVGALSLHLLYAELARMQTRCARPLLFGDEVRWESAGRAEKNETTREKVSA